MRGRQYGRELLAIDPTHRYRAVDGAANVERASSQFVQWADVSHPRLALPKADWVLSLEVGEHIRNAHEKHFVRNLHAHNRRGLVLSWARLRQRGHGHVNNHNATYIERLFGELGYVLDTEATSGLSALHSMYHKPDERRHILDSPLAQPATMRAQRARMSREASHTLSHIPMVVRVNPWFEHSLYVFRRAG